jgi:hypothetical protein
VIIEPASSPLAFDLRGRRKANATATNSARATPPRISQRIFKKDLLAGSVSDFFSFFEENPVNPVILSDFFP